MRGSDIMGPLAAFQRPALILYGLLMISDHAAKTLINVYLWYKNPMPF